MRKERSPEEPQFRGKKPQFWEKTAKGATQAGEKQVSKAGASEHRKGRPHQHRDIGVGDTGNPEYCRGWVEKSPLGPDNRPHCSGLTRAILIEHRAGAGRME